MRSTLIAPVVFAMLSTQAVTPLDASQDSSAALEAKRAAMRKVEFLVGQWEGKSVSTFTAEPEESWGTEVVESRLDGLVLIIEGRFWNAAPGTPTATLVHNAVAIVSYDPDAGHYLFRSQTQDGRAGDYTARFVGDAFQWSISNPRGQMRYTIRLTEKGEWHEIGERSRDGQEWRQFFEMTMRRAGETR